MSSFQESILNFALNRPKLVIVAAVLITVVLGALILRVDVDTDPENMLRSSNPVRVLNQSIKADFGVRDVIVLGIVDEGGVLNGETLERAARLVDEIKALDGVVAAGVVSFTMAGDIPGGDLSPADVSRISTTVDRDPLLAGQVISPNGNGLAVYIPLESKSDADGVSSDIEKFWLSPARKSGDSTI